MGPTSANVQPARFVFCLSQDSREKLASVASEANAAKIRKAPAAVVVGMDMDFPERMPEVFPHNPDAKHWFSGAMLETTAFRNSSLQGDRKSTRLNSSHSCASRMPSSASNKKSLLAAKDDIHHTHRSPIGFSISDIVSS